MAYQERMNYMRELVDNKGGCCNCMYGGASDKLLKKKIKCEEFLKWYYANEDNDDNYDDEDLANPDDEIVRNQLINAFESGLEDDSDQLYDLGQDDYEIPDLTQGVIATNNYDDYDDYDFDECYKGKGYGYGTRKKRGMSEWNKFVKAHKGMGYTISDLGIMYRNE